MFDLPQARSPAASRLICVRHDRRRRRGWGCVRHDRQWRRGLRCASTIAGGVEVGSVSGAIAGGVGVADAAPSEPTGSAAATLASSGRTRPARRSRACVAPSAAPPTLSKSRLALCLRAGARRARARPSSAGPGEHLSFLASRSSYNDCADSQRCIPSAEPHCAADRQSSVLRSTVATPAFRNSRSPE
jgi:hypothetical protein